jgi:hypothetical protein
MKKNINSSWQGSYSLQDIEELETTRSDASVRGRLSRSVQRSITEDLGLDFLPVAPVKSNTKFKIPVKQGVSYANVSAICLIAVTAFLLSTFFNA